MRPGGARDGHHLLQQGAVKLIAGAEVRCGNGREGRMSRLNVRKNPGKVVLERAEGVASCLPVRLTSFAEGMQHFILAPHES
jgi:hypothetical protein